MAAKKTGKIKKKLVTRLGDFLISEIKIPDTKINPLTLPTVKLEYCDGSAWYPLASESWVVDNAGTVKSITAGTGLSGGTITTSGTINIANTGIFSGTYAYPSSVSVNAQGQLTNIVVGSPYVSSVACIGSTGITVSGSPITSIGTFNLTLGTELQALSQLNTTGFLARTGAAAYSPLTITAGTGISVTNGNGVSGNPTISVSSIDINNATTGQLNISRLVGYPTSSSSFLRGDGTWNQINLSSNVTGSLPINKLAGYPGTTTTFLRGDGTWSNTLSSSNIILSGNIISASTGNNIQFGNPVWMSDLGFWLKDFSDTNHGMIYHAPTDGIQFRGFSGFSWATGTSGSTQVMKLTSSTLLINSLTALSSAIPVLSSINMAGNNLADVQSLTVNKIYARYNSEINVYNEIYIQGSKTPVFGYIYGYLNSAGNIGVASGSVPYSLRCTDRVAASEFNATSSRKIKCISKEPLDISDLKQKFLNIPFKAYEYLDPSMGHGKHYGIIAEELMKHFPQFVDGEHERYVPNCRKLITLTKIEGLDYFFSHDFDLAAIDPHSKKIKIVMGDMIVETTIVTLTKKTLQVTIDECDVELLKEEHQKNHYFAYGTYEKCPTVSKNKLFELALILLQNMLREEEARVEYSSRISLKKMI